MMKAVEALEKLAEFNRLHSKNSKIVDYLKVFGMCLLDYKEVIKKALKLLAKIEKGELAVVPVEPTEEMIHATSMERISNHSVYVCKAAIEAAPPLEELIE